MLICRQSLASAAGEQEGSKSCRQRHETEGKKIEHSRLRKQRLHEQSSGGSFFGMLSEMRRAGTYTGQRLTDAQSEEVEAEMKRC